MRRDADVTLRSGRYVLGPNDGTLLVKTGREGAASRMGHDLTLRATRWRATVIVDASVPARSSVQATIDARSLEVMEASGGAVELTDSQKDEIERNTRQKVLHSDRRRTITFASTAIIGGVRKVSITGDLTIGGTTCPATLEARVNVRSDSARIVATTAIVQSQFGIQPYSALFGALRVRDLVELVADVRLPERPAQS